MLLIARGEAERLGRSIVDIEFVVIDEDRGEHSGRDLHEHRRKELVFQTDRIVNPDGIIARDECHAKRAPSVGDEVVPARPSIIVINVDVIDPHACPANPFASGIVLLRENTDSLNAARTVRGRWVGFTASDGKEEGDQK